MTLLLPNACLKVAAVGEDIAACADKVCVNEYWRVRFVLKVRGVLIVELKSLQPQALRR